jgi:hypothetical protein
MSSCNVRAVCFFIFFAFSRVQTGSPLVLTRVIALG